MTGTELAERMDELQAAHRASVERGRELLGRLAAPGAADAVLRSLPGPARAAVLRARDEMLRAIEAECPLPRVVTAHGARAGGVSVPLSARDFAYRTLGR